MTKRRSLRFEVEPGDVPADVAARRLGLTAGDFSVALPELLKRGFPPPDTTTGNFDLEAIDVWRRGRHAGLFGGGDDALNAAGRVRERLEARFGHG